MSEKLLTASDITMQFGGLRALDSINVEVASGELLGIVGPNGAGKSTLFNVLAGALTPTMGRVSLRGEDITRTRPDQRAKLGISRTFQTVRPFENETLVRNVAVAALVAGSDRKQAVADAEILLERVGLGNRGNVLAAELGHGERKRLELARALANRPRLLLIDEVMAGLNPIEVRGIVSLLLQLRSEMEVEIVVIEHLISAVRALADRVIVLDAGRILAEGEPGQVFEDPKVITAYLGTKA